MDIVTRPVDFNRLPVKMVFLESEADERATLLLVHEDQDEVGFARRVDASGFDTGTYVELESINELVEIEGDYGIEVSPKLERSAKSKGLSVWQCLADAYLAVVVGGALREMYPGMSGLALCRRLNLIEDVGAAPPIDFLVETGWDLVLRLCDLQLSEVLGKVATYEGWQPGYFDRYVFTADGFVVAWFDGRWRAYDYREHLDEWLLGAWEGEVDEAAFDRRYNELLMVCLGPSALSSLLSNCDRAGRIHAQAMRAPAHSRIYRSVSPFYRANKITLLGYDIPKFLSDAVDWCFAGRDIVDQTNRLACQYETIIDGSLPQSLLTSRTLPRALNDIGVRRTVQPGAPLISA